MCRQGATEKRTRKAGSRGAYHREIYRANADDIRDEITRFR